MQLTHWLSRVRRAGDAVDRVQPRLPRCDRAQVDLKNSRVAPPVALAVGLPILRLRRSHCCCHARVCLLLQRRQLVVFQVIFKAYLKA
jgi:hypothetical protein